MPIDRARAWIAAVEGLDPKTEFEADAVPIIRELLAVVERMPKTRDGVTITPGMDVWRDDSDAPVAVKMYGEHQISYPEPVYWLSGCYSTWEAACHARAVAESARKDKP